MDKLCPGYVIIIILLASTQADPADLFSVNNKQSNLF